MNPVNCPLMDGGQGNIYSGMTGRKMTGDGLPSVDRLDILSKSQLVKDVKRMFMNVLNFSPLALTCGIPSGKRRLLASADE